MKAKQLASILNKISIILDNYGEESVEKALNDIIEALNNQNKTESTFKEDFKNNIENDEDVNLFIEKLDRAKSEEVIELLNNKPKKFLLEIAKKLSLTSSSRQSIATLTHSIMKFYERRKIDDIIRNERHD